MSQSAPRVGDSHPSSRSTPTRGFGSGGTKKLELLRERGTATVVFRRGWIWAAVQGPVRLIGPGDPDPGFAPEGLPRLLRDIFTAAGGTHDDWDTYDRVMAQERRCAVFVEAKRISGTA